MTTQSTARDAADPLAQILARVEDDVEALSRFVCQYYTWVPPEDLSARDPEDLYGAALAHWNLAAGRSPGEVKLHIYNPDPERDGWDSPHTALDLVTDDMPFLVDSVEMEISRLGYDAHLVIHPMIRVQRDADAQITAVLERDEDGGHRESFIHVELEREDDHGRLVILTEAVQRVLSDVRAAVRDWYAMREHASVLAQELAERDPESGEFLRWLAADHFTFLGYREYDLTGGSDDAPYQLSVVPDTGQGILAQAPRTNSRELSPRAVQLALDPTPLLLTKANSRATVHRPAPLDYVGVKRYDAEGTVVGERRFLGLYTTTAYRERADRIPLIRGKVAGVLERAGFPPDSHDAKALAEICESQRRDTLFQISTEALLDTAVGILGLGERQQVRVFLRADPLERYVNATVCLPRDRYNRDTRTRIGQVLVAHFGGSGFDYNLQIGESRVATIHMVVHTPQGIAGELDADKLGVRVAAAIRPWSQDLRELLIAAYEERQGRRLAWRYEGAFPPAYQSMFSPSEALDDIDAMERVHDAESDDPRILLYRPAGTGGEDHVRAKLMSPEPVSLSRVMDIFAHMGASVSDEEPYEIHPAGRPPMWLYDFGLECAVSDLSRAGGHFARVFVGVWRGELENDYLGELVIAAGLGPREITVLRAVFKYLRQAGMPFSDRYVERTLVTNPRTATLLVELFEDRHDPAVERTAAEASAAELRERLGEEIDAVASLDEDRILRAFLNVIEAVLRTNYYQRTATGRPRDYLSFKLDSRAIDLLPHPRPRYEIFVYSPRVEGVHLRGGSVARGGLRWSDRREDFRTEILGLMKAQMVKNALIVPVGSKGGFIVKHPPADGSREALMTEGIACYQTFLCGLLDLTDNIVDGAVVAPTDVVRYDADDPYLVVAADKGTASFSDIANAVSADYGFWLGDAFASGGSVGYDHKAMGITARGAWESVKRHFRELGTDIQTSDFTVAGIGDMSGDVFGNGMLLSHHTRLVAAFNHQHIFLDPDPDPAASYAERERLFHLPRSAWSDYDAELISPGGGIFDRSAKQIQLSAQVREALGTDAQALTPAQLISAILRAPVDLLFNGGIGTYVKATEESDQAAGDRTNDAVRVNGAELRARVVGEGGNLGLTQAGRIEYARGGGRINTDAIDNVAGVNCSDHEVNIKILLDSAVRGGELDPGDRDALLAEMTQSVSERVLRGSYLQTQALSLALAQAPLLANTHARVIGELEAHAGLDRDLERLPSDQEITERQAVGGGLLSPELAVVLAYTKINLDACLLASDLPEDPSLTGDLHRYFPEPLPARFGAEIDAHRLRREIIATTVANELVNRQGSTFTFRLSEQTGAAPAQLARAYAVAREVQGMGAFWAAVESLDNVVDAATQLSMLLDGRRLVERAVRWLVRFHPNRIDVEALIDRYQPGAELAAAAETDSLDPEDRRIAEDRIAQLTGAGVPEPLARRVAGMDQLPGVYGVTEVAARIQRPLPLVLETSRRLGTELSLSWLRRRVLDLPRRDRWQALARDALRDDLDTLHRGLTGQLLSRADPSAGDAEAVVSAWREAQGTGLARYLSVLDDIRDSGSYDTTTLPVALRELRILVLR